MATIEELQAEVKALRDQLNRMCERVVPADQGASASRVLSRRNLLRAAPVVAAGGAIAALSASPAAAGVGDPVLLGKVNHAGSGNTTKVTGGTPWKLGGVDEQAKVAVECDGGMDVDWLRSNGVQIGTQQDAALHVNPPYLSGLAARFVGEPDPQGNATLGIDVVSIEGVAPAVGLTVSMKDVEGPAPR
jgi:hypothetical protein